MRRDYEARRAAGLAHRWLAASAASRLVGFSVGGGLKVGCTVFDPHRACLGLAVAASKRGAGIFERSPVMKVHIRRDTVEVETERGVVTADIVVVARGGAMKDLEQLRRHLHPRLGYAVVTEPLTAASRRETGARTLVLRDSSAPPHVVRWLKEDRVLVSGAASDPVPSRSLEAALTQRAGQLMYELSLMYPSVSGTRQEWAWSFPYDDTVDGLPFIGTHRNFPRHFFGLGTGRHGAAAAWLTARLLLRHVAGAPAKGDDLFGFSRILTRA